MRGTRLQVPVESQIGARQQLGGEDNLPRVHREMLDDVVDRFHHRDFVSLNRAPLHQLFLRQAADDGQGFLHRGMQPLLQLGFRYPSAGGEFAIAPAQVRLAPDARNNPLAHVPAQVQRQVAQGILVFLPARPNLLVA